MAKAPSMELSAEDQELASGPAPDDGPLEPARPAEEDGGAGDGVDADLAPPVDTKAKPGDKAKVDAAAPPKKQETVPHAALEEERQKRKTAQRELQAERQAASERNARLEERLSMINQALQPPPEQAPNPDEDIFGAFTNLQNEVTTLKQTRAQEDQQRQQAWRQQQEQQGLVNAYVADAEQFKAVTPDFQDAYQHMRESRRRQLGRMGFDRATIEQTLYSDEISIATSAFQHGLSPAQVIYDMAHDWGYTGKAADTPANGAGGAAQPQPAPDATQQVERLKAANEASATLSGAGGALGGTKIDLGALDRMSKAEFDAFVIKVKKGGKDPKGFDRWMESQMVAGGRRQ